MCIIWGLSVRCPASGFPEQVNVAVGVGGHHRVSGGDKEGGPGSITGLQVVDLEPPAGLETDPLDVVLLYHGMGAPAHVHHHGAAAGLGDHRDVDVRTAAGVGVQFLHGPAAAGGGGLRPVEKEQLVAAVRTGVKLQLHGGTSRNSCVSVYLRRGPEVPARKK